MPGRKRKKRTDAPRLELEFLQCPFNIVQNQPEKVRSGNPKKVDVVPVVVPLDIKWVSPQFRNTDRPSARILRRRPLNYNKNQSVDLTTCKPQKTRRRAGPVLKFVGDETTVIEEVNISELNEHAEACTVEIPHDIRDSLLNSASKYQCNNETPEPQLLDITTPGNERSKQFLRTPRRQSAKGLSFDKTPGPTNVGKVLVCDTPQAEYGMTLRERQVSRIRYKSKAL